LVGEARQLFIEVIGACAPQHFEMSDVPLLAAFCRASALERQAAAELAKRAVENRAHWLDAYTSAVGALCRLAASLKLSPRGRKQNWRSRNASSCVAPTQPTCRSSADLI
jgi:phage terminase small subunit